MKHLLFLLALPLSAAITNVRVSDVTNTQAAIRYVAPSSTDCSAEVSESAGYTPLIHDVDPALFSGSNLDSRDPLLQHGLERVFVVGRRTTEIDSNGKLTSRAAQKNTQHFFRITCGGDTATGTFHTAELAAGNAYNEPAPVLPSNPGQIAWPTIPWTQLNSDTVIDPQTGILVKFATRRSQEQIDAGGGFEFSYAYAGGANCANGGGWTNPCNMLADDGASATYTNTLTPQTPLAAISIYTDGGDPHSVDTVELKSKAYFANGTTGDGLKLQVCFTNDQINCYGPWVDTPALPTLATYTGQETTLLLTDFMNGSIYNANQQPPAYTTLNVSNGTVDTAGSTVNVRYGSNLTLMETLAVGAKIYISATEYEITSIASAIQFDVTPAPGTLSAAPFVYGHLGLLIRKKTASADLLTMQYARVVLSKWSTDVLSGGSGFTQVCDPNLKPQGWTIAGATNAAPIVVQTGQAHGYSTGDTVVVSLVHGNTAANGTFPIIVTDSTHLSLTGSTGNGAYDGSIYHGLVYRTSDPMGFECAFPTRSERSQKYWINPRTGERRYTGVTDHVGPVLPGISNQRSLPNVIGANTYWQVDNNDGRSQILNSQFNGNTAHGWNQEVGPCGGYGGGPCNSANDYYPTYTTQVSDFHSLISGFDANWDTDCNNLGGGISGLVDDAGSLRSPFYARLSSQQNGIACYGYFDIPSATVLATGRTWKPSGAGWVGQHSFATYTGMDRAVIVGNGLDGGIDYMGPYGAQWSGTIPNTTSGCATILSGLSITNHFSLTDSDQCTTITVVSDPSLLPGFSPPHAPNTPWRMGDTPQLWDTIRFGNAEQVKIVGISGSSKVLLRTTPLSHAAAGWMIEWSPSYFTQSAYPLTSLSSAWQVWDWKADPTMANSACPYGVLPYTYPYTGQVLAQGCTVTGLPYAADMSHGAMWGDRTQQMFRTISDVGGNPQDAAYQGLCDYGITEGSTPAKMLYSADRTYCVNGTPKFSGTQGANVGNISEKHPNNNTMASGNPAIRNHYGDGRTLNSFPDGNIAEVALVGGTTQLYSMSVTLMDTPGGTYDPKRSVPYGTAGHHAFYEISGPGASITDADGDNWKSCISYVAGDCWGGSAAGTIYFNCPKCNPWPAGSPGSSSSRGDYSGKLFCPAQGDAVAETRPPCWVLYASASEKYARYPLYGRFDDGRSNQPTTHALSYPNTINKLWTGRELPDGSWGFVENTMNGVRFELAMFKLGEMPQPDGVNRGEFIPTSIPVPAIAGATKSYVRFGYDTGFVCNPLNRKESCISTYTTFTAGTAHPFMYETTDLAAGNYTTGAACTSGCTIVLPLISQRMTYYQIVWTDNSNVIQTTGPVSVLATP